MSTSINHQELDLSSIKTKNISYIGELFAFDTRDNKVTFQLDCMPAGKAGALLGTRAMITFLPPGMPDYCEPTAQ